MKVKLLVSRALLAGPQGVGDEVEVNDVEAIRMINAGQAVAVRKVKPEKTIRRKKSEKAIK